MSLMSCKKQVLTGQSDNDEARQRRVFCPDFSFPMVRYFDWIQLSDWLVYSQLTPTQEAWIELSRYQKNILLSWCYVLAKANRMEP